VRNAYGSDDVADFRGNAASFESDTPYFGWHAGAGYVTDITETISLDVYGQYLTTRTFGETATLSTGDPVMFEDTVSSRLRLGGRMAYDGQVARPFIGAAWEREFDGRQRGSVNGYALDAPSLAGNTGTVEVGLGVVPSANRPLTVELGAEGSGGSRTGVSGHLQVRLEF
jgi:outer membrane autotransporter protein